MKTAVAVFRPHIGQGRERRAAGTDAEWLAMKRVQEPDSSGTSRKTALMTLGGRTRCRDAAMHWRAGAEVSDRCGYWTTLCMFFMLDWYYLENPSTEEELTTT